MMLTGTLQDIGETPGLAVEFEVVHQGGVELRVVGFAPTIYLDYYNRQLRFLVGPLDNADDGDPSQIIPLELIPEEQA